jgi:hypothetical protein
MTSTTADTQTLLAELSTLLRLTRTEAQVARVRISQARREDTRRELADNAAEADERATRIQAAIRALGATPDVFADAVGRVTALTKATFEQAQPFSEGLLGDLALEHQLRDRAVFARVLAEAQDEADVVTLMRSLEDAHTETIEWITVRLAEVAQGGPAALTPTPTQAVVGTVTRLAMLPSRQSAALISSAVGLLQRGRTTTEQAVETTRARVSETSKATRARVQRTTKATGEVVEAGRDAALERAEKVAPSPQVRKAAHETRDDLGTIESGDLPIKSYDNLSGTAAIKAVGGLRDADDVQRVLRFETAHKNRKGVLTASQKRLTQLAAESVDA